MTCQQIVVLPSHHISFPRTERRIRLGDTDVRGHLQKRRPKDQAPSFSRCGRHPRYAASGTKTAQSICFRAIVKRSRRWSPAFHSDPSPQSQERKKKKERRKAERRQTRSPRPVRKRRTGRATEKAACAALPLRARSPAGVPPRHLRQRPNATAQLQFTRFLGRYSLGTGVTRSLPPQCSGFYPADRS